LFCERARAHDPGFELNADHAGAVAEICRRVDGLPLGIELAAARCGLLAPEEIAERLHAALGALGTGPRDAPARQRTLRATIDWSHQLLDDDEQAGFARFAVFRGGATVDAAEAITGADIDTLDRLVAKSLLVRRPQADGSTRLGMLETVRAFAGERFAAAPECESIRERHFHYFLSLAQRPGTDQAILGPRRDAHFSYLDLDIENLRAALEWASGRDAASEALELSAALIEFWHHRGRHADAVGWVEQALRNPSSAPNSALRVRALCKIAWPLWALGRGTESLVALAEAEAIASPLGSVILAEALPNRSASSVARVTPTPPHRSPTRRSHARKTLGMRGRSRWPPGRGHWPRAVTRSCGSASSMPPRGSKTPAMSTTWRLCLTWRACRRCARGAIRTRRGTCSGPSRWHAGCVRLTRGCTYAPRLGWPRSSRVKSQRRTTRSAKH